MDLKENEHWRNALHHAEGLMASFKAVEDGLIIQDMREHIDGMEGRCRDILFLLGQVALDLP